MIIKNNEKEYTISFFPSDKDGLGLAYENHTRPDAPKKAFIKILIAAGFLGVISAFVFTPPADEYSASTDAAIAVSEVNGDPLLTGVTTPAPEIKSGTLMPSFASKALSALTSSKPAEPEKEAYITTESRTVTLSPDATTASKEIILKVKSGDNIVTMMKNQGISNAEANRAAAVLGKIYDLKKVRPGQTVTIVKSEGLFSVTLRDKDYNKFSAVRDETGEFIALTAEAQIEIRKSTINGIVTSSFSQSAENQGIPKVIAAQFIRAFNDVINFKTDLHPGDSFEVVFEERFNDLGENLGNSRLLYGSLKIRNQIYNRYYFKSTNGVWSYYDEQGNSQKQAINVWPVGTTKITSRFGTRRHPILMYTMHHSGVDYAAPIGTPVAAAADGKIVYIGTKGGYGKYVQIKHEQGYATAYAHLNSYNKNLKVGSFVKQGDIVAYSGNTGRSTGPHLHFEVIKNGQKIDPLGAGKFYVYSKLKGPMLTKFMAECAKIKPNINVAKNEQAADDETKTR